MLIRSQDKTALVKFENIVINLKLPESLRVICWSLQDAQRSGGYFVLGEYSTKAKALKVLDMIQDRYADYQTAHTVSNGLATMSLFVDCSDKVNELYIKVQNALGKSTVFQMPEDSEVEG